MRYFWFLPLLASLAGCSQQPAQSQSKAQGVPTPATAVAPVAPAAQPDPRPAIVCFGDSLTAGLGLDPGQAYPDLLQKQLDSHGYSYRVVNLGVSGDTTQDGLDRLPLVLAEKPRFVVLEFGANDGLRGQPVPNAEKNLAQMIEQLQDAGARVILAGITLPPNYGPDYIGRFNAMYPDLAARYKVSLIPFLLKGVAGNPNLMQRDGLHPNAQGEPLVVQTVWRSLEPLLRRG